MCIYVHHIEWHRAKIYNSYNTTYWYVQEKIQSDGANNEPTEVSSTYTTVYMHVKGEIQHHF